MASLINLLESSWLVRGNMNYEVVDLDYWHAFCIWFLIRTAQTLFSISWKFFLGLGKVIPASLLVDSSQCSWWLPASVSLSIISLGEKVIILWPAWKLHIGTNILSKYQQKKRSTNINMRSVITDSEISCTRKIIDALFFFCVYIDKNEVFTSYII